jgi:hypothetical protein
MAPIAPPTSLCVWQGRLSRDQSERRAWDSGAREALRAPGACRCAYGRFDSYCLTSPQRAGGANGPLNGGLGGIDPIKMSTWSAKWGASPLGMFESAYFFSQIQTSPLRAVCRRMAGPERQVWPAGYGVVKLRLSVLYHRGKALSRGHTCDISWEMDQRFGIMAKRSLAGQCGERGRTALRYVSRYRWVICPNPVAWRALLLAASN